MTSILSLYKNWAWLATAVALGLAHPAVAAVGDPAGGEFQVNTFTLADQKNAAVAMNAAGGFIVVWESSVQAPGDFSGIYAQRYAASGAAVGGEFQVNAINGQDEQLPAVAMNDAGAFVVVWEGIDQNGALHVYSRRFDAGGAALGDDQEVSSTPISLSTFSTKPAVAMDGSGNYVVAWEYFDETNGDEDIYARRFSAAGTALSADFRVNTTLAQDQTSVALAMDTAGDFIVAWQSAAQDGDGNGIYAQLYDAAGGVLKSEFQVNTTTLNEQTAPAAAMSSHGFVVAWQSLAQDGDGNGIYARRYDALGTALGGEFPVNTTTASEQTQPAVGMNAEGFTVAWESLGQDGDLKGVFAQRFDANGATLGGEFQVNATAAKDQALPAVAVNADSASVVAWQSYAQDSSWNGVFAQHYMGHTLISATGAAAPGGGGGGAWGLFSLMLIVPALLGRRRA